MEEAVVEVGNAHQGHRGAIVQRDRGIAALDVRPGHDLIERRRCLARELDVVAVSGTEADNRVVAAVGFLASAANDQVIMSAVDRVRAAPANDRVVAATVDDVLAGAAVPTVFVCNLNGMLGDNLNSLCIDRKDICG
jgi:hypothetical protein